MSSACRSAAAAFLALACLAAQARELRVCADPDNLPLSHQDGSGFENRIAELVAAELGAQLRYEWLPLRRGFVRKTLGAGLCDVFIGVPREFERVATTRPYYRSSFVFVEGPRARDVETFSDPRLAQLRIGVQLVGNDLAATPPGHALARAGLTDNVRGYTIFGDGPAPQRMVAAVAAGELDAALVWGPQAGYFAAHAPRPLTVRVAHAPEGLEGIAFEFDIAMGVRRGDRALRDELDGVIERRRADIDAILASYSVPRTDRAELRR
jgi:quinoprotein dehydrogenase-associated probable ABC transporter substrate-binding protein